MTIEAVPDTVPVVATPVDRLDVTSPAASKPTPPTTLGRRLRAAVVPVIGTIAVAAIVELLVRTGVIDERLLSPPTEIVRTLVDEMGSGDFWSALGNSMRGWATGLLLAIVIAIPAGVIIGANEWVFRSMRFLIDFVRPIPSIALLPLLMLVVGIEPALRTYMVAISAVWPLLFQTMYGVQDVDPVVRDMARSYRLGPLRRFFSVQLPGASPFIATGLRLSVSVALLLTVGTEMVVGMPGLGSEISRAQYAGNLDRMYALVAASGLLGMLITAIFTRIEKRTLRWHPSQRREAGR